VLTLVDISFFLIIIVLRMSVITESEKKRLRSLKEKKQAFKAKGQLIQQALSNLVSLLIFSSYIMGIYIRIYVYTYKLLTIIISFRIILKK